VNAARYGNDPANWRAFSAAGTPSAPDPTAAVVFSGAFGYAGGPRVTVKFSKEIASSLAGGLTVVNRATGQAVPAGQITSAYDPVTQTATWALPAALADGNYRATLAAAAAADAQGRPLDGNSDGAAGDDYAFDFFHLAGDATRDRVVNFDDLLALAKNYNSTGATYGGGDFNYDGAVNFDDLLILAKNYNKSVPVAAPIVEASPVSAQAWAAALGITLPTTPPTTTPTRPTPPPRRPPAPAVKPKPVPAPKPVAPSKPSAPKAAGNVATRIAPPAPAATFARKKITDRVFA
jgi:hypothetical protein